MKCLTTMGVVGIVLFYVHATNAQTSTIRSGRWSTPSVWSNGIVPDASSQQIMILHDVVIPEDTTLTIDELVVNANLQISKRVSLILSHKSGASADLTIGIGSIKTFGNLICRDSAKILGSSAANTFFYDSAIYEHQYFNSAGEPPFATWYPKSTLKITGYTNGKSLNAAKWNQVYGHIIYDCPQQRSGTFVDVLGNIQTVKGDFIIRSTNTGVLRLSLDKTTLTIFQIDGNFIIEGKSEVWFGRNSNTSWNIGGDLIFRSSATASSYFTTTGKAEVNVHGSVIVNATGPLRFASGGGGTSALHVDKDFSFERGTLAVISPGKGIIDMAGAGAHTFTSAGMLTAGIDVQIDHAENVFVSANSNVAGNLLVRSNTTLHLPDGNFTLQGNLELETGADLIPNKGTLTLTGSSNQVLKMKGDTLNNIAVSKSAASTITLEENLNLRGTLNITSSQTNFISNGHLILLSQSDDGTRDASVSALPQETTIIGNVTVQRHMNGEGRIYRYISPAVSNATIADCKDDFPVTGTFTDPSKGSGINSTSASLFYYNETLSGNAGWINYPSAGIANENLLIAGRGYSAFIRNASTSTLWDVTGLLNQHDVNFDITYTPAGDALNDGWNLIGNPYPSAINWDVNAGWEKHNVADKIVVKDNGEGMFQYWTSGIGNLGSGKIAMGQAFWIQTTEQNPSLKIKESAKSSGTEFHRKKITQQNYLEISLTHNGKTDKTYLLEKSEATALLDVYDILKWDNDNFNIAFSIDGNASAINAVNYLNCSDSLSLLMFFPTTTNGSFVVSPAGTYNISCSSFGSYNTASVLLHDNFNNTTHDICKEQYGFDVTAEPETYNKHRFYLSLHTDTLTSHVLISTDTFRCKNSPPINVHLDEMQHHASYELWLNDSLVDMITERDVYTFSIADDLLLQGENFCYLKARNACYSKSFPVWKIRNDIPPHAPAIREADGTLYSSYQHFNQWYRGNEKLEGETASFFKPDHSGKYKVSVDINGCTASIEYDFILPDDAFHCYPVPARNRLNIISKTGASINKFSVVDQLGRSYQEITYSSHEEKMAIDITEIPPGIYVIEIISDKKKIRMKFMKE